MLRVVTQTWSKEQQVSKGGWEEETVSLRYYTVQEEAFEKGIRSVIDYLFQTRKDKNILVTERYKNTLVTGMLSRCRPRSTTQELFTYSHVECFCSLFEWVMYIFHLALIVILHNFCTLSRYTITEVLNHLCYFLVMCLMFVAQNKACIADFLSSSLSLEQVLRPK